MRKFDTLLFDLDGTLLDTLGDLADSVNYVLSRFSFENRTEDEIRTFIGNGIPTLIRRSLPADSSDEMNTDALRIFSEHYMSNMKNRTRPYEGIEEMLQILKNSGYKIGVVSNKKDPAVKGLCSYFFGGLIDSALGATTEDTRKPSPKLVNVSLGILKSNKEKTITIPSQTSCLYLYKFLNSFFILKYQPSYK
jgi:phosphoglycolate phosphatase